MEIEADEVRKEQAMSEEPMETGGAPEGARETAEAPAPEHADEVDALRASLDETRRELKRTERRRAIELALVEAGAMDLEAGRVLIEHAMRDREGGAEEADAPALVEELRSRRPYLFRRRPAGASVLAARDEPEPPGGIEEAAEEALRTGETGALLRYLRLRRNG